MVTMGNNHWGINYAIKYSLAHAITQATVDPATVSHPHSRALRNPRNLVLSVHDKLFPIIMWADILYHKEWKSESCMKSKYTVPWSKCTETLIHTVQYWIKPRVHDDVFSVE